MIRWQVTAALHDQPVMVALDVPNGNQSARAEITGENAVEVREELQRFAGAFGHALDLNLTTAIDLDAALKSLPEWYEVEVIEGAAIAVSYATGLDPDALT
jgi:hypothetical protein